MRRRTKGFTLLEVMVSVAILGLGLTAILSAQAGVFASASHARNISMATGLLRCKMTEVEEKLLRNGFQELDETDSGICCEGDDTPMKCSWKIEKPQLPDGKFGELDLGGALNLAGGSGSSGGPGLGGLLAGGAPGGGAIEKPGDLAKTLAGAGSDPGALAGAAAGGISGIVGLVMSFVYPTVKTILEASTRRVIVTLSWREGRNDFSIDLVQWVTSPQRAGVTGEDPDGGASTSSSTGSGRFP